MCSVEMRIRALTCLSLLRGIVGLVKIHGLIIHAAKIIGAIRKGSRARGAAWSG